MRSRRIYRNTLKSEVIYEQFQKNRGVQFDPEITDTFLRLLDEGRLVIEEEYAGANVEYGLTEAETEIEKFITNVISTMCTQEDSEGFDFLTGLPMRNRGEKLAAQFMQRYSGFLVFLDMDNMKKLMISMDIKPVTGIETTWNLVIRIYASGSGLSPGRR